MLRPAKKSLSKNVNFSSLYRYLLHFKRTRFLQKLHQLVLISTTIRYFYGKMYLILAFSDETIHSYRRNFRWSDAQLDALRLNAIKLRSFCRKVQYLVCGTPDERAGATRFPVSELNALFRPTDINPLIKLYTSTSVPKAPLIVRETKKSSRWLA